jgi:hypothetical protein
VNVRHEDGCGVVVLLAASGGSFGVGLGAFSLAGPADEILGAVGNEDFEHSGQSMRPKRSTSRAAPSHHDAR